MIKKVFALGLFSVSVMSLAQKISIAPSFGYAWRVNKIAPSLSPEERSYIKGLKNGTNFDIALRYEIKNGMHIGFKYSNYSASHTGRFSARDNMGNIVSAVVSTKDAINFYGPSFTITNYDQPTKHKFMMDAALGAMSYTTKTGNVKGKGNTLGAEVDFAYQYQINKNILIGPKVGLSGGALRKISYNGQVVDLGEENREGLSRVSLAASATFRF
ncbi:hypothetical protein AB670_03506 [Chryseobacterium sp. MOF25P]|uniref:hypothetical protein n=1 Tax=unclassified Chryseobacterium TaxID=2593645 RepID=UPI000805E96E|nr:MULTISPECIES: hypothetical protein [unclassified Chryseobacterium]OBW40176.1 hypothetical protein AB670_03506 [Chryseobacterium sp. MOF25P]OBW45015.1 hypothetical protein AB671_02918 [Chryseobacterium sp. BGARF1]